MRMQFDLGQRQSLFLSFLRVLRRARMMEKQKLEVLESVVKRTGLSVCQKGGVWIITCDNYVVPKSGQGTTCAYCTNQNCSAVYGDWCFGELRLQ